jgi:hypothetical protein
VSLECPLCGFRFTEAEMITGGCGSCASSPGGCGLVRCPACGYEWPPESSSRLVGLIRKVFRRER